MLRVRRLRKGTCVLSWKGTITQLWRLLLSLSSYGFLKARTKNPAIPQAGKHVLETCILKTNSQAQPSLAVKGAAHSRKCLQCNVVQWYVSHSVGTDVVCVSVPIAGCATIAGCAIMQVCTMRYIYSNSMQALFHDTGYLSNSSYQLESICVPCQSLL